MRHYPRNSPQAAARIVALAILADGRRPSPEPASLRRLRAAEQLGLDGPGWHEVVNALCQDLLLCAGLAQADLCRVDAATMSRIMGEVDDPELRLRVLQLCTALIGSDGEPSEGQAQLLMAAVKQWGLHSELLLADAA